jgi:signal transduction histidine kinase
MLTRRRLRSRIIISFVAFGTLLTCLFAASTLLLREYLEARLIGEELKLNLDAYATSFYTDQGSDLAPFERIRGWVYSERRLGNVPFAWRELANGVHDLSEVDGEKTREYKLAVRKDSGYWFFLRYEVTDQRRTQRRLTVAVVVAVAAFAFLGFVIGVWSSARVMRPVSDLAGRIETNARLGKHDPLAPHFADDEVGQVASALDDYAERLTALVERDREFNQDVSHELRTPLAVIASTTELLLSQPDVDGRTRTRLERIERASKQSAQITEALLLLSRQERGLAQSSELTPIQDVVMDSVDVHRPIVINKPVEVKVSIDAPFKVRAPRAVVAVALGNLISNAFKYTPSGTVEISAADGRVTVADSGPGVAPEELEHLFDRHFRSAGATEKGSGLGLAIVRRLCELYGWRVQVARREPHGLIAHLDFQKSHVS